MIKVLVLGSEGFIGNSVVNALLHKQIEVIGCDLLEGPRTQNYAYIKISRLSPQWEKIFKNNNFDYCINASGSGNVPFSVANPLIDFEANTLDVIRVLDAIRIYQPNCTYLHISSAAVYGNPASLPIKEEAILQPVSPYGFHKLMSEQICKEYFQLFEINSIVIRPFSVYGPGIRKQLFWDLCNKVFNSNNNIISLFGSGNETRDFIYIDDLVQLIVILLKNNEKGCNIYNAASGVETSIKQIADIVAIHAPSKQIVFNGEVRQGDPLNWRANISKIEQIGFVPQTTVVDGVTNYINWFLTTTKNA